MKKQKKNHVTGAKRGRMGESQVTTGFGSSASDCFMKYHVCSNLLELSISWMHVFFKQLQSLANGKTKVSNWKLKNVLSINVHMWDKSKKGWLKHDRDAWDNTRMHRRTKN